MALDSHILVFPAGMPASVAFARRMREGGRSVVGASSLDHDPESERYDRFARLPWILDAGFASALQQLIARHQVTEIFSPHPVVWEQISVLLPAISERIYLHPHDWDADFANYARYYEMAGNFASQPSKRPCLQPFQLAGLIRLFEMTPGQCSHAKLEALVSIFRDLPAGDIVEIGTLFGRSAVVLAFLARQYAIGSLLCVDPWSTGNLMQGTDAVDRHSMKVPIEAVFQAFLANLAPWQGAINYMRMPSIEAAAQYANHGKVNSPEFGVTPLDRRISLLHLDGNHAFEAVRADVEAWTPLVQADGWIIFDDYRWPFGDGPKRVADEFCNKHAKSWDRSFEAGGALFVHLTEANRQLP